jgi:nucleoside-diphosphate-sugar epimerase
MRALVTGCAGFVGSHLTESLLGDGHQVLGVDCFNDNYAREQKLRNLRHAQSWEAFDFVPLDLARGDLRDIVEECEVVFHLAAEPGVRSSWGGRFDSYLRNNVLATQHLLEAAKECPEKRFVLASSSSIYGQAERLPTPEDTTPAPFSPYGTTKLAAEHLCGLYHGNYGVATVILRYFTVYGPRQRPDMAFTIFCRAAAQGQPITVYGDGRQSRDFTFVGDVVAATRSAASSEAVEGGSFNIGGGSRVTLAEALLLIEGFAGQSLDIRYLEAQLGDVRDTGADTTRARERLDFTPDVPFEVGLERQFEWAAQLVAAGGAPG